MASDTKRVTITTPEGTLSFPHLTQAAAENNKNDKGIPQYDCQIIIPKSDREGVKTILRAIKEVGEAQYGANWKKVRIPLRDGDKEASELTEDGKSTKGEKYPERLGCYFLNARSQRPVAVVDRARNPVGNIEGDVYGGCKVKIAVEFYPYAVSGNVGIGSSLQGVQKIADGEPFGASAPAVESMFDVMDAEDDSDLDDIDLDEDEPEPEPTPKKRAAKKAPAKKAAAKKPEPEDDEEDLNLDADDDDDDPFDDLDDSDA